MQQDRGLIEAFPPPHQTKAIEALLPSLCESLPAEPASVQAILQYPITNLAYLGDAWYELELRQKLSEQTKAPSGFLNRAGAYFASAPFQAMLYPYFEAHGNPREVHLLKRARNHQTKSQPKHGDLASYHHATAIEALLGFWLMNREEARARTILHGAWCWAAEGWDEDARCFRVGLSSLAHADDAEEPTDVVDAVRREDAPQGTESGDTGDSVDPSDTPKDPADSDRV